MRATTTTTTTTRGHARVEEVVAELRGELLPHGRLPRAHHPDEEHGRPVQGVRDLRAGGGVASEPGSGATRSTRRGGERGDGVLRAESRGRGVGRGRRVDARGAGGHRVVSCDVRRARVECGRPSARRLMARFEGLETDAFLFFLGQTRFALATPRPARDGRVRGGPREHRARRRGGDARRDRRHRHREARR
eukprot:14978-Pelagococcus_subviridis.AAC.7